MLLAVCAIFFITFTRGEEVGDPCVPTQHITEGECKLVSDCEIAIRLINEKEHHPFKRCGFNGIMEIICCPNPPAAVADIAKKPPKNTPNDTRFQERPSTTTVRTLKDSSVITDKPSKTSVTRIADKQCQKILQRTLPPSSLHIIGGADASLGEFPHMVALGYDTNTGISFKCGGALISESFVLTAAHCASNPSRDVPTTARMGVIDLGDSVFNPATDVKIVEVMIYPEFTERFKYHDIALLRLERPVTFSETLIPACLYTAEDIPTVPLTVTGWGRTAFNSDVNSQVLQKANVTAVSQPECAQSYSKWRKLPNGIGRGQFCAGDTLANKDTCQGDSGGPLQGITEQDGHYRIIGITSFGRGCGGAVPGVYTRVAEYREWIERSVWSNEV